MRAPQLGRFCLVVLTAAWAAEINAHRAQTEERIPDAVNQHRGNTVTEGCIFPALIVKCWDSPDVPTRSDAAFNVQVFLDGNDTHWLTSIQLSERPEVGKAHWWDWETELGEEFGGSIPVNEGGKALYWPTAGDFPVYVKGEGDEKYRVKEGVNGGLVVLETEGGDQTRTVGAQEVTVDAPAAEQVDPLDVPDAIEAENLAEPELDPSTPFADNPEEKITEGNANPDAAPETAGASTSPTEPSSEKADELDSPAPESARAVEVGDDLYLKTGSPKLRVLESNGGGIVLVGFPADDGKDYTATIKANALTFDETPGEFTPDEWGLFTVVETPPAV